MSTAVVFAASMTAHIHDPDLEPLTGVGSRRAEPDSADASRPRGLA
jgi:hypothetical protein